MAGLLRTIRHHIAANGASDASVFPSLLLRKVREERSPASPACIVFG